MLHPPELQVVSQGSQGGGNLPDDAGRAASLDEQAVSRLEASSDDFGGGVFGNSVDGDHRRRGLPEATTGAVRPGWVSRDGGGVRD